jgi:hypothetical protein
VRRQEASGGLRTIEGETSRDLLPVVRENWELLCTYRKVDSDVNYKAHLA